MKNNELFLMIEHLKDTLSDVASAREQVSETVKAYGQTQTEISSYISNLKQIEAAISSLITLLQNHKSVVDSQSANAIDNLKHTCDAVVSQAKSEFVSTSQRFSDDTRRNLSAFSSQVQRLDQSIGEANKLTNKVKVISREVSEMNGSVKAFQEGVSSSLKSQDKTIEDISKKLNVANMSLSKLEEVLTQHEKALDAMRKNLSDNATSIVDKLTSTITSSTNSLNKVYLSCFRNTYNTYNTEFHFKVEHTASSFFIGMSIMSSTPTRLHLVRCLYALKAAVETSSILRISTSWSMGMNWAL